MLHKFKTIAILQYFLEHNQNEFTFSSIHSLSSRYLALPHYVSNRSPPRPDDTEDQGCYKAQ